VFGWIGFDLRAQRDPFAQPNETVERGLFVESEEERTVVVDAVLKLLQHAVDSVEFGQPVEDDSHLVGRFDPRREDDDPVAVVARVFDAVEVELLGQECPECVLDPLFVLGRITEGTEIDVVKRDSRHGGPSGAVGKRTLIRRDAGKRLKGWI